MLLGDNSAMIDLINKDGTTSRSRYFERATMLIKYAVIRLLVTVKLISTNDMMADIFTKAVDKDTFLKFRMWLMNEPIKDRSRLGRAVQALAEALCKARDKRSWLGQEGALRRGSSSRDDCVNDVAFPISLVCVCMYVRGAYWHLWETGGNVSSGSRVFLCADRLARARVLYEACGVDPQAV
jgi:hypothetical protein